MSKLMIALLVAAGLGFAGSGVAQTFSPKAPSTPMSEDSYSVAKRHADAQYKIDSDACSSRNGNAKNICVAEAKGRDSIAKAEAEAAHENTSKARQRAHVVHAQANFNVAMEKCDDVAGDRKDICVKEAKAALVKGKADARFDRVVVNTRHDVATTVADASKEANPGQRDAKFKAASEKCDALAGPAKDTCMSNAKAQYGKS